MKKKCLAILLVFVLAMGLSTTVLASDVEIVPVVEEEEDEIVLQTSGGKWVKDSKGWWYQYDDGSYPYAKWEALDGEMYYFDQSGYMATGWKKIDGDWYYFESSGLTCKEKWNKISGKWYYFESYAMGGWPVVRRMLPKTMTDGIVEIDGTLYYFDKDGALATGWAAAESSGSKVWYYFTENGPAKGWLQNGGKWYYLAPSNSGAMVEDTRLKIGSEYYAFDKSGAMITGWNKDDSGKWRYYASSGKEESGWIKAGSKWYYLDPTDNNYMVSDMEMMIDVELYYFDGSGAMYVGWRQRADGTWMYYGTNGEAFTGWVASGGKWYYTIDGEMVVNRTIKVDAERWAYFDENGVWSGHYSRG